MNNNELYKKIIRKNNDKIMQIRKIKFEMIILNGGCVN